MLSVYTEFHIVNFLSQDMVKFFLLIVKQLGEKIMETPLENGRRMLSVITIMCCIWKMVSRNIEFNHLLKHSSMSLFLNMLRLRPERDHKRCIDWEYLDKNIPTEFKQESYDSVQMFIKELSKSGSVLFQLCIF